MTETFVRGRIFSLSMNKLSSVTEVCFSDRNLEESCFCEGTFGFFLCLDIFQKEGGGLSNSKLVEELFCLSLETFWEGGGEEVA